MYNNIGYDCTFEMNDFNEPRLREEAELIKNVVLLILFMKPGQYPSIPHLGMNIQDRLYSYYDEIDESAFARELMDQCQILGTYIQQGSIVIKKMIYRNMPSLIIYITTATDDDRIVDYNRTRNKINEFYIGISVNELNKLLYNVNARAS
jgi:hypothetical protein